MMLTAWLMAVAVWAQDNGLNPVYKVQLGEITYQKSEAKKKVTVGKVLGVIADVAEGRVTDINNEEYIPLASNCVKKGLTHVRRLQTFEGDEMAEDADYRAWVDGGCLGTCPGGESKEQFCRRACAAFERLMEENAGLPELTIVAHGGTLMAVLERFGRPERAYFDWHCPCGCGFRLSTEDWERDRALRLLEPVCFTGGT